MEIRDRRIIVSKAGGTAGKNSLGYKISLPSVWMADMGITEDNREVEIVFYDNQITIRKKES